MVRICKCLESQQNPDYHEVTFFHTSYTYVTSVRSYIVSKPDLLILGPRNNGARVIMERGAIMGGRNNGAGAIISSWRIGAGCERPDHTLQGCIYLLVSHYISPFNQFLSFFTLSHISMKH